MGKLEGSDWVSFGGHRLWHFPEVFQKVQSLILQEAWLWTMHLLI